MSFLEKKFFIVKIPIKRNDVLILEGTLVEVYCAEKLPMLVVHSLDGPEAIFYHTGALTRLSIWGKMEEIDHNKAEHSSYSTRIKSIEYGIL